MSIESAPTEARRHRRLGLSEPDDNLSWHLYLGRRVARARLQGYAAGCVVTSALWLLHLLV